MPAQQIKDYYKILEISANATGEEVKRAFRKMALKHHPDTNSGGPLAESYFMEVKEAYNILGNEIQRCNYDNERWLAGMGKRADEQREITPLWILQETIKLDKHMATVDVYRMSHGALRDYILHLLNDSHLAILLQSEEASVKEGVVHMILHAVKGLKYQYMQPIATKLESLAEGNSILESAVAKSLSGKYKQYLWEQSKPYVILVITLAIVLGMYFWTKR